jgi:integrase
MLGNQFILLPCDDDLLAGYGNVYLPDVLEPRCPSALREWAWQYVFPAPKVSVDPRSGITRRHHLDEKGLQRAMNLTVKDSGMAKPAMPHILRHSFLRICLILVTIFVQCKSCLDILRKYDDDLYTVLNKGERRMHSPLDM